ncbi:chemotaxis protein CheA [Shinella sp. WSJ-2]|uniref:chemotaxis protein CheA n=1 Tax=Shinella sp. WSJ-2 TaxID=2303749 RepID=UPI000E3D3967|nr:chemotaxis protein CheA [Shinella sp. WSJ-2]RFZ82607.1 chemotaxis protein CheA [Shinella sp. WSJ-2]
MDELIAQFAIEARELVQQASEDLLSLEGNPAGRERLESAFRAFHTLKGSASLFEFGPMLRVLHRAEDLLSQARAGKILVDADLIEPLFAVIAWVDDSIDGISQAGRLPEAQERQAARLLGLLSAEPAGPDIDATGDSPASISDWAAALQQRVAASDHDETVVAIRYEPHPECFFNGDDPLATMARLPAIRHLSLSLRQPAPAPGTYDPFRSNLLIEAVSAGSLADVDAVFRLIPDQVKLVPISGAAGGAMPATVSDNASVRPGSTLRVNSARIERLIEIAGELVIAKNGLAPLADDARNHGNGPLARQIAASHAEIERLVASLYSAVTRARMIPLEYTFRRFPRLVRETSSKVGKAVDLVIEGETVEADREIVENLFEPLLHLIRNGLDHGIETEADRLRQSKPARGRIVLRTCQRGDQIEIEVSDDGRGMDPQRVKATAIARGLLTEGQATTLSQREILQFAFVPGFSTAASVTDLSGRGVGLDVVQRSIQGLGGTLDLQSTVGFGTTFKLRLPVSFSMAQLMVVKVGGERYGIPISDVVETQKLPMRAIQPVKSGCAFVLRNRTIPLLRLSDLLSLPSSEAPSDDLKVLIVRSGAELIGVAVDAIAERAETLTRPLTGVLKGVPGIAGTTLLGDGKVLLVLDLEELIQ